MKRSTQEKLSRSTAPEQTETSPRDAELHNIYADNIYAGLAAIHDQLKELDQAVVAAGEYIGRAIREVGLALVAQAPVATPGTSAATSAPTGLVGQTRHAPEKPSAEAKQLEQKPPKKEAPPKAATLEDAQRAMIARVNRTSASATRELLKAKFGVEKVTLLKGDQYAKCVQVMEAA